MLKLISWNVNGVRAVERKGEIQSLINKERPDILFLQETKASPEQLSNYLVNNENYHQFYHKAIKKGYSGVSVWISKGLGSKISEPVHIHRDFPNYQDDEGRVIAYHYGGFILLGVYFPNGGKSAEAWQEKLKFYDRFLEYINMLKKEGSKKIIFCGDFNVAHNEIDLARPKENMKSIGFRPEERSWVDRMIADGWIDTFRYKYPNEISYTWWDMPSRARERNVGWRIDYFFMDQALLDTLHEVKHLHQQMGSDHCPVSLELDTSFA